MITSVNQKLKNSISNNCERCGRLKTGTALFPRHLATPPVTLLEPIGCSDSQDTEKGIKIDTEPNQHQIPVHVVGLTGSQPLLIWKYSNGKKNVLKRFFIGRVYWSANFARPIC